MTDYVNTETKTCIFGYGGIRVKSVMQYIYFYGIRPPVGAGTYILDEEGNKIGDWDYTGSKLNVLFNTAEEVHTVNNLLNEIEENQGGSFTFKGITFDFTTYEQASMNIMKSAMELVTLALMRLIAC
jgi:hypothetical protein